MVRLMLVLGLVLSLAACSGGDRIDGLSEAEEAALQERVDVAEAARIKAEEEKATADAEKAAALERERLAEEEQERQRQLAEDALLAAEAAKREQDRLKAEAEAARLKALQLESNDALAGLGGTALSPDPTVDPKYRAPALVRTNDVTFTSPSGSSAGKWYVTTASNQGPITDDTIVVYSDVGAPKQIPIGGHEDYGTSFTDPESPSNFLEIAIGQAHKDLIKSSRFPTTASQTFTVIPSNIDTGDDNANDATKFRGTFDGASGDFQCSGTCSVRYTGAGYLFGSGQTWTFRTTNSAKVRVPDKDFMYFGWWRRKTNESGAFSYGTFSSQERTAADGTEFNALEGSATYEGPAIGQYAIYQPLGTQSNHGEFKATARFMANFTDNKLSGSVFGFDVSPGWSLTLKESDMVGGQVTRTADTVSWTIDGNPQDGGGWSGVFHSEILVYDGHPPDGLTGEFDAVYSDVGSLRGAYGAHVK